MQTEINKKEGYDKIMLYWNKNFISWMNNYKIYPIKKNNKSEACKKVC